MRRLPFYLLIAVAWMVLLSGCNGATMVRPDDITYPPLTFSIPEAERVPLRNGIILYILEDHELPLVNISAVIRTGSVYDPVDREGLAEIAGIVMRTGGTKNMTGDEIDGELDFMATHIAVSMGRESGTATLSVMKNDVEKGIAIFSDILMNPVFHEGKLDLAKKLKIEELRRIYDNPQKLAFREFVRLMYQGNQRGRLSSIKSVKTIERGDCERFHQRFFYPGNIMMAVTGDIRKDDAIAMINRYFNGWDSSGVIEKIPAPPTGTKGSIQYLFKDSPQSIIIMGNFAPGKEDSAYYPFEVLDFIIGSGGFRSRIFSEIRSNLGLAYSAGSFYSPKKEYGVFGAYAMTKPSSTVRSLSVIKSIMADLKRNTVTEEDLQWAQKAINNTFIFSFSSAPKIALQQLMLDFDEMPSDFLTAYRNRINQVTSQDLQQVACKFLVDEKTRVLVLGNEKEFDKPLGTFGDVTEIDILSIQDE